MSLAWYSLGPHTVCLEFPLGTADLAHVWAACSLWPYRGSGLAHLCVRSGLSIPRQADRFSAYPLSGDPDQAGFSHSGSCDHPWLPRSLMGSSACQDILSLGLSVDLLPWSSTPVQALPFKMLPPSSSQDSLSHRCEGAGKEGSTWVLQTYLNWIQFPPTHPYRELGWALKPHESSYL